MNEAPRFDAAYYERYYFDRSTRIYPRARLFRLVAGVVNLIEWLGGPLESVLDAGAGVGWWGEWLARHRRRVQYVGTELEPDICERFGHRQADVRTLELGERFDLVVCQGVLPYLDEAGAERAIERISDHAQGYLYLEAITSEDVQGAIDSSRTDLRVHLRPAAWYREHLRVSFRELGAGLFVRRDHGGALFALEAPPDVSAASDASR